MRLLHVERRRDAHRALASRALAHPASARAVMRDSKPLIVHQPSSSLWVPIKEGGGRERRARHPVLAAVRLRGVDRRLPGARRGRGRARAAQRQELRGDRGPEAKARGRELDRPPARLEPRPLVDHAHPARGACDVPQVRRLHPGHHHADSRGPDCRGLPVRGGCRRGRAAGGPGGHRPLARGVRDRKAGAGPHLAVGAHASAAKTSSASAGPWVAAPRSSCPVRRPTGAWCRVRSSGCRSRAATNHGHALPAVVSRGRLRRMARASCCRTSPRT